MTLGQRWKQTALHNKALVWTSVLVAFGTLFYAGAVVVQIYIAKQSAAATSEQNERLIGQADKITKAMLKSIQDASEQNRKAVEANTEQNRKAIEAANVENRRMVDAGMEQSRTAMKASEAQSKAALDASIANSRLDLRPWVILSRFQLSEEPEADKPFFATVWLVNSGKTPAINADQTLRLIAWFSSSDPPIPNFDVRTGSPHFSMLAPGGVGDLNLTSAPITLNASQIAAYVAGTTRIYEQVKVTYSDAFAGSSLHWTTICVWHAHGRPTPEFGFCDHQNDVDRQ